MVKEKTNKEKRGMNQVKELLAGSIDVEFMPDGRMRRKGKRGKGTALSEHTFYAEQNPAQVPFQK